MVIHELVFEKIWLFTDYEKDVLPFSRKQDVLSNLKTIGRG